MPYTRFNYNSFCVDALEKALRLYGVPEIFNTDQGSQFTNEKFVSTVKENKVRISMDGKGSFRDNIFVERLWRSVKYECVCITEFKEVKELRMGLKKWFGWYNTERPHQALEHKTPNTLYQERQEALHYAV